MIDVGGFIYEQVDELGQSIFMERARWHSDNYSKWPTYFDGTHYDRWQSSQVFNFVDGYYSYDLDRDDSTAIGYLCEHIEARLNWLAAEWGCDVVLRERSFEQKALVIDGAEVELLYTSILNPISMSALPKIKLDIISKMVESGEAVIVSAEPTAVVDKKDVSVQPTIAEVEQVEYACLTEYVDCGFFKKYL